MITTCVITMQINLLHVNMLQHLTEQHVNEISVLFRKH